MKKILFLGAMAAMLLGTASCSNEVDQPAMGDEVNAAFSVSMDGIESRAISDGLTVNELYFEVYEAKTESATTTYTKLPSLSQKVAVASKTATVTTKLIKGKTYKFAFWAQKDGAYVATDLQNIQMNYAKANANDENRDAFFANVEKKVEEAFEQDVTLYRPFAQINFGASDVDAAMDISGFTSQLVVKNVTNQFNVLSGVASGEEAEVTLAATAVPAVWTPNKETLTVDGKDYTYISMNYILATPEKTTKDITLKVMDGSTEVKVLPVSACPMQRNYRTNILGDILSVEGKFNITIDQNFNTPDYNVDANAVYYDVNESSNFESILNAINTDQPKKAIVRIAEGATLTLTNPDQYFTMIDETNTGTKEVIFEGAGKDKSFFKEDGGGVDGVKVTNGAKITFRNLTIIDDTRYNSQDGNNAWEFAYLEFYGNFKFENVKFADGIQPEGNDSEFEFVGCDFISDGNPKRDSDRQNIEYAMWACGGKFTFTNCTVTGYRGLKFHEKYGSDITCVYFDNCVFHDITLKPGIAIGDVNAPTIISIKNSRFINCQPGDQGLYKYETDTPVANFQFTDENNTVVNN